MTDRPQPDEITKQRWREAERAHDELLKREEFHTKQVDSFSVLGMRSLGVIAGAGIAAALGFYSANYDRLKSVPAALDALNSTLVMFFAALLMMLLCILLAYFSQVLFAESMSRLVRTWEHPYSEKTKGSIKSGNLGRIARWGSILAALASAGAIVAGGISLLTIVR